MKDPGRHIFGRPMGLVLVCAYKAAWGLAEVIIGVLLFYSPQLIAGELAEDPQDLFLKWFLRYLHLTPSASMYGGEVIVLFGVTKILLAIALWNRLYFVRDLGLVVFSLLGVFGLYELAHSFSWFELIAWSGDVFILVYFWKFLPAHLKQGRIN